VFLFSASFFATKGRKRGGDTLVVFFQNTSYNRRKPGGMAPHVVFYQNNGCNRRKKGGTMPPPPLPSFFFHNNGYNISKRGGVAMALHLFFFTTLVVTRGNKMWNLYFILFFHF
jgi:hypothetical protein